MRKVFLVNIGVNASHGSIKSPIFDDGTFIYCPIPESSKYQNFPLLTYKDILDSSSIKYLPEKYRLLKTHNDPEFTTFTYGDYPSTHPRVANLKYARVGDFLFFLARLVHFNNNRFQKQAGFFLIGFIEISSIVKDVNDLSLVDMKLYGNNAHVIRCLNADFEPDLFWLFKGNDNSRLFTRAVPFTKELSDKIMTDREQKPWKWAMNKTALQVIGSYTRSCRMLVNEEAIQYLCGWIEKHQKDRIEL